MNGKSCKEATKRVYTVKDLDTHVYPPEAVLWSRHEKGWEDKPWLEINFVCGFFGTTNSGKTHFLHWVVYWLVIKRIIFWGVVQSGSAKVSNDLKPMQNMVIEGKDPGVVKAIYEAAYKWKKKTIKEKEEKSGRKCDRDKINLPAGIIIRDDVIGSLNRETKTVTGREEDELFKYCATQGRRLNILLCILMQYPTVLSPTQRDNLRYAFLCTAHGNSMDYIYEIVNRHNIWQSKSEFRHWVAQYLVDFQVIGLDTQARDPRDMVRIFKAPPEQPKWTWKMRCPPPIVSVQRKVVQAKLEMVREALVQGHITREEAEYQIETITSTDLGINPNDDRLKQWIEKFFRDYT